MQNVILRESHYWLQCWQGTRIPWSWTASRVEIILKLCCTSSQWQSLPVLPADILQTGWNLHCTPGIHAAKAGDGWKLQGDRKGRSMARERGSWWERQRGRTFRVLQVTWHEICQLHSFWSWTNIWRKRGCCSESGINRFHLASNPDLNLVQEGHGSYWTLFKLNGRL